MSFYLRPISNKFTSFVNVRKQATDINYQLLNNIKSSLFLDEFLDTQGSSVINDREKHLNSTVHLSQNEPAVFDANIEGHKNKKYNWTKQRIIKLHKQKQMNTQMQCVIDLDLDMTLLKNNAQWEKSFLNLRNKSFYLPYTKMVMTKRISDNVLLSSQKDGILYAESAPNVRSVNEMQASEDRNPIESNLQNVFDILRKDLPLLFVKQLDYEIYTKDLVFVNNIRGTTSVGIQHYFKQIAFLKIIGHLKYAFVKFEVLKMTMHPEDNSIKVRWRIVGISGTRVFLTFWKIKMWNSKEQAENTPSWYDGFSTFYVNNDGKVFKHVVDKTMPDQNVTEKFKSPIDAKLALFVALSGLDTHFTQFCLKRYTKLLRIK
ncbi:uncharacterized protein LOC117233336 [Bombus vosnesenskii]|uniref:Uncharacterized protein LOC117233336 n=1 Tax=Bombus vosnesenskii TaxID=207650 RepID=A0A6J3K8M3_9HYME|nr:uncharacterized protein LOC117233336 [Bombus vosnesenskii]